MRGAPGGRFFVGRDDVKADSVVVVIHIVRGSFCGENNKDNENIVQGGSEER